MTKFQKLRDRLAKIEQNKFELDKRIQARRPADFVPGAGTFDIKSHNEFFFAICDYILRNDIEGFRKHLIESAECRKILFVKYGQGEKIEDSFVGMHAYPHILKALAAGDFPLAHEFAELIGGRDEIEKHNDLPFDRAFGYALKACILDDKEGMKHWLPIAIKESPSHKDTVRLSGYAEGVLAIYNHDEKAFDEAMKKINEDHKKLSGYAGIFQNTPQEVINVWALGLINLARHKGLDVTFNDDEYLPKELII